MPHALGYYEAVTRAIRRKETGNIPAVGSKAQVWHGTALHTSGNLYKKDLMEYNGRIVSRRKHELGMKAFKKMRADHPFRLKAQEAHETGGASLKRRRRSARAAA